MVNGSNWILILVEILGRSLNAVHLAVNPAVDRAGQLVRGLMAAAAAGTVGVSWLSITFGPKPPVQMVYRSGERPTAEPVVRKAVGQELELELKPEGAEMEEREMDGGVVEVAMDISSYQIACGVGRGNFWNGDGAIVDIEIAESSGEPGVISFSFVHSCSLAGTGMQNTQTQSIQQM